MPHPTRLAAIALLLACIVVSAESPALDRDARRWVDRTLASLSVEEQAAQLVMAAVDSTYLSTDTQAYEELAALVRDRRIGGLLVFGGTQAMPPVLLNPTYGSVVLGDPLSAASTLNHLQRLARVPLLTAGDFEFGVGMRIRGATQFPRAMAFGAAGDERLAEEAGRITAAEMRAIGVHVDFAPVADVNNNPRNPVINTRSFGEDPARVGALASAFARGLQQGGVIATLKHFPGHGDTDVDTHVGLATVPHDRARLDSLELVPFRAGLAAGAGGVMIAHLALPGLGEQPGVPATLSRKAITELLRRDLGFDGLVFTDSLTMAAVAKMASPGEIAVRAVEAGNDVVLHSPDPNAAVSAIAEAIRSGRLGADRIRQSVRRILEAKARMRLTDRAVVDLDRVADAVGGRAHQAVADAVNERAITLLKDDKGQVPLSVPPSSRVLHLSILDYPANWRISPPGRTFIPALKEQWAATTAIELSDRGTAAELDLVRAMAPQFDAIVIAAYVRAASGSGRMDLAQPVVRLVQDLARSTTRPMIVCLFGNPYVASLVSDAPAVLLTYDLGDGAERAAARAIRGMIPVRGRLPIALPGLAAVGAGVDRPAAGSQ